MRASAFLVGLLAAGSAFAQLTDLDPDWKELEVPPPAAFRSDRLVAIDMPPYVTVKLGIDPDTLTLSDDGIVRYVMVVTSRGGAASASYEGIWCRTGQVKVYAYYASDGKWNPVAKAQWKPLSGSQPSMHALALARQGVCDGRSASSASPQAIIRKLKQSPRGGSQK